MASFWYLLPSPACRRDITRCTAASSVARTLSRGLRSGEVISSYRWKWTQATVSPYIAKLASCKSDKIGLNWKVKISLPMWYNINTIIYNFLTDKYKNSVKKIRNEYLLDDFVDERSLLPTIHCVDLIGVVYSCLRNFVYLFTYAIDVIIPAKDVAPYVVNSPLNLQRYSYIESFDSAL